MTDLARLQEDFLAELSSAEGNDRLGSINVAAAGMAIYRNAYRTTLIEALQQTFPRTLEYAGKENFDRAAAHHLISHPPGSWSLDHVGEGYSDTLAEIFRLDPEVAELAALEWAMHIAFVAADAQAMSAEDFTQATQGFADQDWAELRLTFLPAIAQFDCTYDLLAFWQGATQAPQKLELPGTVIVWREEERSVFTIVDQMEGVILDQALAGATFGDMCEALLFALPENEAVSRAGTYLQRWFLQGWVSGIA